MKIWERVGSIEVRPGSVLRLRQTWFEEDTWEAVPGYRGTVKVTEINTDTVPPVVMLEGGNYQAWPCEGVTDGERVRLRRTMQPNDHSIIHVRGAR